MGPKGSLDGGKNIQYDQGTCQGNKLCEVVWDVQGTFNTWCAQLGIIICGYTVRLKLIVG